MANIDGRVYLPPASYDELANFLDHAPTPAVVGFRLSALPLPSEQRIVVGESRQHQDLRLRQTSANLTGRLDTAPIREPDVHDDHVRTSPLHPGDSFLDGPGFANDRDVGFGFEQRLDPIPDNFVVVNQHNP